MSSKSILSIASKLPNEGPWSRYLHNPDARGIGTVR